MTPADEQQRDGALSAQAVRRGLRINMIAGSLGMVWVAVAMGIPLTMFFEALEASGVQIGLSVTVQQLTMALQIPAALLAERLASRKRYWGVVTIAQRAVWFVPACLPFLLKGREDLMAIALVGVVAVSAVLIHAGMASWWSWMADLVPEDRRGSFWGRRQSLVTLSHLVAVWASGFLLDLFPDPRQPGGTYLAFQIVFAAAAVLGTLDIVIHLWVPEPPVTRRSKPSRVRDRVFEPLRNRDFRVLTLAMGVWTFGVGMVGQYGFLFLKREYGLSYAEISLTAITASLGTVIAGFLWGYVMDRLGPRNLGAITMALAPACGVVWFFMRPGEVHIGIPGLFGVDLRQPVAVLLVSNLVAGVLYSGVGLTQVGLLGHFAPQQGRTVAMAVHWSAVGLIAALGPVVAGALMDRFTAAPSAIMLPTGTRLGFFHILVLCHMAVTWFGALPLLLAVRRLPDEVGVRTAMSRLFVGNPIRAVGSLYNIYAMFAAPSSTRRADAVRRIGDRRTALAVKDLIARLDDPAIDVREEAVIALGKIGCPEAVDALVRRFNDPQSDALPQIARALREARDPRSVDALMLRLSDADRETVAEAARALGEIGDRRAAGALLALLKGSADAKVVSAASQSLARLGELAAAYEILPRMVRATNPVLRSSLALAAADLVGEPGVLYQLATDEQRDRGEGVSAVLRSLRESISATTRRDLSDEGARLSSATRRLADAYERGNRAEAVRLLLELATGLGALRYGMEFGADALVLGEVLTWYNERLGTGMWYLHLLQEQLASPDAPPPQDIDVLLGIYFLSLWRGAMTRREPRPA